MFNHIRVQPPRDHTAFFMLPRFRSRNPPPIAQIGLLYYYFLYGVSKDFKVSSKPIRPECLQPLFIQKLFCYSQNIILSMFDAFCAAWNKNNVVHYFDHCATPLSQPLSYITFSETAGCRGPLDLADVSFCLFGLTSC